MPSTIIPCLRYRDAMAAIDWLCRAFGFERQLVVADDDGVVQHAQLVLRDAARGDAMIMLGSASRDNTWGRLVAQPGETGGRETQSPYIVIDAIDAHCERAIAAGATIVMPIADQDYGGRLYVCRDPEGHVWSFGSYCPWSTREEAQAR